MKPEDKSNLSDYEKCRQKLLDDLAAARKLFSLQNCRELRLNLVGINLIQERIDILRNAHDMERAS